MPAYFYEPSYKIDRALIKTSHQEELRASQEVLKTYLGEVDLSLEKSISKNFDFFNRAFNNIDEMKDNMRDVSLKTKTITESNRKLK